MNKAYEGICNILNDYRRHDDKIPINTLKILKRICEEDAENKVEKYCKTCHYASQCKEGEIPGSNHCLSVLLSLDPLEAD